MVITKKVWWCGGLILLLLIVGAVWWFGLRDTGPRLGLGSTVDGPTFEPLTTESSTVDGAVKNAAYDANRQVYSFQDSYQGSIMSVSQQPIPLKLANQPDGLAEFAAGFKATEKVPTSYGNAYLATDTGSGQQRLVLIRDGKLIFITSQRTLAKPLWGEYVRALH
jgi:hypothetical protein